MAITQEQADELRELCDEVGADRAKFLTFAKADRFEGIASDDFVRVRETLLRKREGKSK